VPEGSDVVEQAGALTVQNAFGKAANITLEINLVIQGSVRTQDFDDTAV
jgi:hypothetical protein